VPASRVWGDEYRRIGRFESGQRGVDQVRSSATLALEVLTWKRLLFSLLESMTLECINPKDLPTPQTYTQVVVATGSKMVFVSGQEPEDIHGKLVGPGDLAAQARQVFGNLGRALAAAGARPAHVARITIYVVNYKRDECLPIIEEARIALFGDHKPADVVLGVATLSPGYLIEVDAIAIID
jgi:enamine deaminase RidA (YjgF/YER057c/UK114 family)